MARIFEYQGKQLLKDAGVRVPRGEVASSPEEAGAIARRLGVPVAAQAQVWATGRYQAGGIRFAADPEEASRMAEGILGMRIKGQQVKSVLVEERLDAAHEYYAGIVVDSSMRVKSPVLVFSTEGGTGVEEVAARSPEKVARQVIDPLAGLKPASVSEMLRGMVPEPFQPEITEAVCALYRAFRKYDASSIEMNPLILTREGGACAADCHVTVDDNSVFRHPELGVRVPRDMDREPTPLEQLAWDHIEAQDYRGTGYFAQMITEFKEGETYVGFHGIGGGGSMLGAAALLNRGIKIANYADTSGDPPASKVYRVIKAIFSQPISGYVVTGACLANQEMWYHAFAMVKALREELQERPGFPVVILIAGNKDGEAVEILRNGLKDLDIRLEIYGRDYIYNSDFIGQRVQELIAQSPERKGIRKSASQARDADGDRLEFETKTTKVIVDYTRCEAARENTSRPRCGFACVKADRMYDRSVLRIEGNRPVPAGSLEDARKNSNESLSWEYACRSNGSDAIRILVPFPGLKGYREAMRLMGGDTIVDYY